MLHQFGKTLLYVDEFFVLARNCPVRYLQQTLVKFKLTSILEQTIDVRYFRVASTRIDINCQLILDSSTEYQLELRALVSYA